MLSLRLCWWGRVRAGSARAAQVFTHCIEDALIVGVGVKGDHQAAFNAEVSLRTW